jgi:hypothetical protein
VIVGLLPYVTLLVGVMLLRRMRPVRAQVWPVRPRALVLRQVLVLRGGVLVRADVPPDGSRMTFHVCLLHVSTPFESLPM